MKFIGITITDLSPQYKEMTEKSIKSFLKFHDTKLLVYVIGDKELELTDSRIEVIHLPVQEYTVFKSHILVDTYANITDILIAKLLCLTNKDNCVFFENDVFFLRSLNEIWHSLLSGITGTATCINKQKNQYGINSGLLCVKNYELNYTLGDIYEFFSNKQLCHPCDQFLTWYLGKHLQHHLNALSLIVPLYAYKKDVGILNDVYSVHYAGANKIYTANYKPNSFMQYLERKLDTIVQ